MFGYSFIAEHDLHYLWFNFLNSIFQRTGVGFILAPSNVSKNHFGCFSGMDVGVAGVPVESDGVAFDDPEAGAEVAGAEVTGAEVTGAGTNVPAINIYSSQ